MVTKPLGRPVSKITPDFFVRIPSRTMKAIAAKKNKGYTWQEIADKLGGIVDEGYSQIYIYRVTKGELRETAEMRRALGLEKPYPKYFKCRQDNLDQIEKQLEKYVPGKFKRIE